MGSDEPQFIVNAYDDPVILKIVGRASFLNSGPVKDLFERLVEQGKRRFVVDFQNCTGMDSTFLGILAGLGIQMLNADPAGSLVLCRLGDRNRELVRNLGLHRILVMEDDDDAPAEVGTGKGDLISTDKKLSELENARLVLEAHENLVELDASNKTRFQDVISYLQSQIDEK
jgi:anti-anti-sigma regulatory factor